MVKNVATYIYEDFLSNLHFSKSDQEYFYWIQNLLQFFDGELEHCLPENINWNTAEHWL